jgi:hypothetical protein
MPVPARGVSTSFTEPSRNSVPARCRRNQLPRELRPAPEVPVRERRAHPEPRPARTRAHRRAGEDSGRRGEKRSSRPQTKHVCIHLHSLSQSATRLRFPRHATRARIVSFGPDRGRCRHRRQASGAHGNRQRADRVVGGLDGHCRGLPVRRRVPNSTARHSSCGPAR